LKQLFISDAYILFHIVRFALLSLYRNIFLSNCNLVESYSRVKYHNVNIRGKKKISRAMCVVFVFYRVSTFDSKAVIHYRCCDVARENGVYGLVRRAKWSQWFSIGAAITQVYSVAKKFASYGGVCRLRGSGKGCGKEGEQVVRGEKWVGARI